MNSRNAYVAVFFTLLAACSREPAGLASAGSESARSESGEAAAASAATVTESPQFVDVAAESGLNFAHFVGASGDFNFIEIMGSGGALLDYDGDGDLDVYLVQGALPENVSPDELIFPPPERHWPGNRLFRNEWNPAGELRFDDVTDDSGTGDTGYGMGVAVGDVDADGDPDLYVTNYGANVFYRNDGNGHFVAVDGAAGTQDERWNTSAAFLDYDRDGDLDLYVASYVSFSLSYNKQCTSPAGRRDYCGPQSYQPLSDRLYRNDGGWRFTDVSLESGIAAATGSGLGVTCADFNGDGWTDIYVANDQLANFLWLNRQDGRFEERGLLSGTAYNGAGAAEASMGVTAGDFDGDGDEDLFMTHLAQQTNTLYRNDGSGVFMDATDRHRVGHVSLPFTGFGSAWLDFDNDSLLDLFVANGAVLIENSQSSGSDYPYAQRNQLFRNRGDGRFEEKPTGTGLSEVGRGAAFGDIDLDGDVDILLTNSNGPVRLLRNQNANENAWLRVSLAAHRAVVDGARVAVLRAGATPLWRRAHSDGSYLSASDLRVHFGLGPDPQVEGIGVLWPDGHAERWPLAGLNREIVLEKGSGAQWRP